MKNENVEDFIVAHILAIYKLASEYRKVPPDEAIANSLLRELQNNRCLICQSEEYLIEDHCHRTGMVRALLCKGCNVSEGKGFTDEPWNTYRNFHPASGWFYRYRGREQQWKDSYPDPLPNRICLNIKVSERISGRLKEKTTEYKNMIKDMPQMEIPYTCYRLFNIYGLPVPFDNEVLKKRRLGGEWPFEKIREFPNHIKTIKEIEEHEESQRYVNHAAEGFS